MTRLQWFKSYVEDVTDDLDVLSIEEIGACHAVTALIYKRAGNLPDDERLICKFLRTDIRVWRRWRAALLKAGKLHVLDGMLRSPRTDADVPDALHRIESSAKAGRTSARKRAEQSNKINYIASTGVSTNQIEDSRIKNQDSPNVGVPVPREEAGQARQRAGRAASDRPEFEVWFDRYPKQTGRDAAAEEYRKARRRVSAAKLLEGLEAAIARWTEAGTEARFIPDPANWLRAGRWDDKPPVAPQLELPVLSAVPGAPETFPARCRRLGRETPWLAQHHHELAEAMQDHDAGRLTDDHLLACFGRVDAGLSARSIRRVALTA